MRVSIFTTTYNAINRGEPYHESMACYRDLADEVVEVADPWPDEFEWDFIGQQFQKGYERATGDWVIHMDIDFLFHEDDLDDIRKALKQHDDQPGITFWKYQIFHPKYYNLKSRLVLAVNKGKYGDRIRFDGGGDLCQPTLDGHTLDPNQMPEARVPFYNYDETFKTKEQLKESKGKFARAWGRSFGEYKWGGPDDESAFASWLNDQHGRFDNHSLLNRSHPVYIQDKLNNITPDMFGYDLFGGLRA